MNNVLTQVLLQQYDEHGNPEKTLYPLSTWNLDARFLSPGISLELGRHFYNIKSVFQRGTFVAGAKHTPPPPSVVIVVTRAIKPPTTP